MSLSWQYPNGANKQIQKQNPLCGACQSCLREGMKLLKKSMTIFGYMMVVSCLFTECHIQHL